MSEWIGHENAFTATGKNADNSHNRFGFWGESDYNEPSHQEKWFLPTSVGSGIGKIDYNIIKGVSGFDDRSVVYLEGGAEKTIEKWNISSTPSYAGLSAGGSGTGDDKFSNPVDVTTDTHGNIYVLDGTRIKIFNDQFQSIGGIDVVGLSGTPLALDWDEAANAIHVLGTGNVVIVTAQT